MAQVYIDGKKYNLNESYNLLQACLSIDLNIPYFCWHPLLGSIGVCRQCAVTQHNDLQDEQGRLVMACMTPVIEGSIISINDHASKVFRKNVIELLLTNHPHDCPVCEEGGHCHLQDMTVMIRHNIRKYIFKKRTHKNQYLGHFIKHEMNRCIGCYRCVRYYKDYADGLDFGVYGANNNIYFGRVEDGILENEHSGNLIEICPTGVFTDKTHSKRYNRKWDMQYAPSVCQNCSVGCNITIGERYGEIRRIENRYHENINHYLICDLGRFSYSYTHLNTRPKNPVQFLNSECILLNFEDAINQGVSFFKRFKRIIGIGSTRSSIENNFSLKELVGKDNFSHGMSYQETLCVETIIDILQNSTIHIPSLKEIEDYDIILVLGEDLTQTSSRVALAVRQAVKKKARDLSHVYKIPEWHSASIANISENIKNSLYIMHTHETKLDDIATWCYYASINDQVRLASAIAYELDNTLPKVLNLTKALQEKVVSIAKELNDSKKTLIISGSHSLNNSIIKAAFNIATAIKKNGKNDVGLTFLTSSSNALGAALLGGMSIESALEKIKKGQCDAIIFMEYDVYRYIEENDCNMILQYKEKIMTIDHQYTQTYKKSGLTLSSTSYVESSGTIVNFEGRAQRFFQVYDPSFYNSNNNIIESWKWLHCIQSKLNKRKISWLNLDDVINAYSMKYSILKNIQKEEVSASFRIHGQKIARSPNRFSGRTSSRSNINIHEIRQPQDRDTMFAFSMEGNNQPNASLSHVPFAWYPGWNSPQAWNKFQKEVGKSSLYDDSGVYLFKKDKTVLKTYFNVIPDVSIDSEDWNIIPYYHLFGNEEMTQYSLDIQKNISLEYALISIHEGLKLGLKRDSIIEFNCINKKYRLSIQFSKCLKKKQIGLPIGRKNFPLSLVGKTITCFREIIQ